MSYYAWIVKPHDAADFDDAEMWPTLNDARESFAYRARSRNAERVVRHGGVPSVATDHIYPGDRMILVRDRDMHRRQRDEAQLRNALRNRVWDWVLTWTEGQTVEVEDRRVTVDPNMPGDTL